jgi:hypothetical protein
MEIAMREKLVNAGLMLFALLVLPGLAWSQAAPQNSTLVVTGQPGQVPVLQNNGRSYVDIEALARLTNSSLSFKGNQIILTPPGAAASTPPAPQASQPVGTEFSKAFLKAGIEEMSVIREWRAALLNLVQNGYPVTEALMAGYRGQAITNLRLASVATSTDSDRNAFQLLSNELDNMQKLSNKFVAAAKNMNYISPDALNDDQLNQQVLTCARSLAAMASSGQFQDDGSCH